MTQAYLVKCECGGLTSMFEGRHPRDALNCSSCGKLLKPEEHPIAYDIHRYSILVAGGDPKDWRQVHAIAALLNCGLVEAERTLASPGARLFEGRALDVLANKVELETTGIVVKVEPPFPWV